MLGIYIMITEQNLIDNGWTKVHDDCYEKGQYEFHLEEQDCWSKEKKRSNYNIETVEQLNSYCA